MQELEPPPLLRVLVAAPYPAGRAGLRAMLDGHSGIEVVGEIASPEFPGEFASGHADVLVAEFDPIAGIDAFGTELPQVLIAAEPGAFGSLISLGRPGAYLLRDAGAEELAAAAWAAARGLVVLAPAVARAVALSDNGVTHVPASGGMQLTERERSVLELVAAGLPNKGIARELGISEHTVKFHVGAILGKLGAASRAEAVAQAAKNGLLSL